MNKTVYENFLKDEYAVETDKKTLIICSRSCFCVAHESAWLIAHLPQEATKEKYIEALSAFGLVDPFKIFERLISIGVLRIKSRESGIKRALRILFMPDFCFIPSKWQDSALRFLHLNPSEKWLRALRYLFFIFFLTLTGEIALHSGDILNEFTGLSSGERNIAAVLFLLVFGSLIHEIGHSLAAAASGIGLRPIGFALYLFFPVLYSNVSGVENLPLHKKIAVDCGGFIAQSMYVIMLGIAWLITENINVLEAISWTGLMMFFNLNPLLKTDGYWLYRDVRSTLKPSKILSALHFAYLAMFIAYTLRLFYWAFETFAPDTNRLLAVINHPSLLLTEGYKILFEVYVLALVIMGGVRRLQESRQELRNAKAKAF